MSPIWDKKPETASRLRSRIERVIDWARVRGHRVGDNPARWRGHLDKLLPKLEKRKRVRHHPALPFDQIGTFMAALRAEAGISPRALELLILTALRTEGIVGARWSEFDLRTGLWTVPAERMKGHREHRVPLSRAALALLRPLNEARIDDFVFPGIRKGEALSEQAMLELVIRMHAASLTTGGKGWLDPRYGRRITPHGFRSTFRDWASEKGNYPRELCEMALAHAIGDQTEAAYRRGDLFEKRRKLMAEWAAYCDETKAPAKVLQMKRPKINRAATAS